MKKEAKLKNDRVVPLKMGPYLHTVYLLKTFLIWNFVSACVITNMGRLNILLEGNALKQCCHHVQEKERVKCESRK